ncbi:exosortase-associated EpsI family protein [Verrucomicrobiota bacterium]
MKTIKDLPVTKVAGIRLELPSEISGYRGYVRKYCQNELCMKTFLETQLHGSNFCPTCSGDLSEASIGEKKLLPPDTIMVKKEYINDAEERMSVSIVLSGRKQKSIHRPQQCMPSQGHVIENSRVISVPIEGRAEPLNVMLLELRKSGETLDGRKYQYYSSFAYWFVGFNRETPYHLQRLFWMSSDRVFRNINHQWAYISVAAQKSSHGDEHIQKVSDFIEELYRLIAVN